jgi:isopentenyl-diphosphate delta-isomerase
MSDIAKRKRDHLEIALSKNVSYSNKTTGFEKWDFIHCALPEIDLKTVDTSISFLSRHLSFPFIIAGITGGIKEGERINLELAEVAESTKVAFAIGSMRMFCDNPTLLQKHKYLRTCTPSVPLIGNIGAVNIAKDIPLDHIQKMVDILNLDAFALHLNPLQEAIQPEGDTDFSSVLKAIEKAVHRLTCPVIVKETGAGLSYDLAQKLKQTGVAIIDIAGAGGTSWAAIEGYRSQNRTLAETFRNWGIPTADCIEACGKISDITLCASGGIENGITVAKALALGADITASARKILLTHHKKSQRGLEQLINLWQEQVRLCMFLTGSRRVSDLNHKKLRRLS